MCVPLPHRHMSEVHLPVFSGEDHTFVSVQAMGENESGVWRAQIENIGYNIMDSRPDKASVL